MNYVKRIALYKLMGFYMALLLMGGCKMASVTTDYMAISTLSDEQKGRELLAEAVKAMGYDKLETIESYQADMEFDWRFPWTLMPMNAVPGSKNKLTRFHFLPNSFDGQYENLEGRKKGDIYGLQSWEFYKMEDGRHTASKSEKRAWALATYHYLIEGPFRLQHADIVQYAGKAEYEGVTYELVFATWDTTDPHKGHDQWLLYIHPETKMVDLVNATIREYFLPMPKNMAEGTVLYKRKKHESGIYFPEEMVIQLMSPKKEKKHVYKILMGNLQVDSFSEDKLRPIPGLKEYGDAKPETKR